MGNDSSNLKKNKLDSKLNLQKNLHSKNFGVDKIEVSSVEVWFFKIIHSLIN